MREYFLMPVFAIGHHSRADLAHAHTVPPTGADQAEPGRILGRFCAGDVNYKSRAVQMRARQRAPNLKLLSDGQRSLLAGDPELHYATRLTPLDRNQLPDAPEIHSEFRK